MSTNELENQPTVAVEDEAMEDSAEDAIPKEKSGVAIDPTAKMNTPTPRFRDGVQVHMSETIGSTRMKGSYQVYKSRYSRSKGYTEYQLLVPLTQTLYNKGAWYREKDLRKGS